MAGIEIPKLQSEQSVIEGKRLKIVQSLLDILSKDIQIFKKTFGDIKKERLYTELGILLSARVDIKTSLELIKDQQKNNFQKEIIGNIIDMVVDGESLSKSLEKTGIFSKYEIFSLQIGEESGKIIEVLTELSRFYKGKIKQSRQIINALSYPIIVIITAFGAIYFMLNFVVPMFSGVFKRFNSDLPVLTKIIIRLSDLFSRFSPIIFGIILCFLIFIYIIRKSDGFRRISSMIILNIPFLGQLVSKIFLARFCHSMHLLISAKTPLVKAIDLVKNMVDFYPIEKSLNTIGAEIIAGKPLHSSLGNFKIYEKRLISLIKVGEEVNQLEFIFEKVNQQYTAEIEYKTAMLSSILEPLIIIFLGFLVALILVAMYLPLFKLSTTIGF